MLKDSQASTVITHVDFYDKIRDVTKDAGINNLILVGNKDKKYSDFDGINYKVWYPIYSLFILFVKILSPYLGSIFNSDERIT